MLRMDELDFAELRRHAEETYAEECCGVLLGDEVDGETRVTRVLRAGNAARHEARNRYAIGATDLIAAEREARRDGVAIVGFYHSHPDAAARWSATDLREAHWLGCSYVITEVVQGLAEETRAFRLTGMNEDDKRFEDEEIVITD